jgi:hypothetical protein
MSLDRTIASRRDPYAAELHTQRDAAEAADDRLVRRRAAEASLLSSYQEMARRERPALERRLKKRALNQYQMRLTRIALKHLPAGITVLWRPRELERQKISGSAIAAMSKIYIGRPPTTLVGLAIFLHEVAHVTLRHIEAERVQTSWGGWCSPKWEAAAEASAQAILRSHGLSIPRASRNYLKDAIDSSHNEEIARVTSAAWRSYNGGRYSIEALPIDQTSVSNK